MADRRDPAKWLVPLVGGFYAARRRREQCK